MDKRKEGKRWEEKRRDREKERKNDRKRREESVGRKVEKLGRTRCDSGEKSIQREGKGQK